MSVKTNNIVKKAFTLIELLIVVVLIAIVYGLYFVTMNKKVTSEPFRLKNVQIYMDKKAKNFSNRLTLICSVDKKICYLLDENREVVEKFPFLEDVKIFTLKSDEVLEAVRYAPMELNNGDYLTPSLIYKKLSDELFEKLIFYTEDGRWVYLDPYFHRVETFINKEDLIAYIKKKDYLPMVAGVAK